MKHKVVINIFINSGIALLFVLLNIWALENNFEETFIFLAILYGIVGIVANACFVILSSKSNI